jgi:predicted negative regulator of RcsB-dependent stress response
MKSKFWRKVEQAISVIFVVGIFVLLGVKYSDFKNAEAATEPTVTLDCIPKGEGDTAIARMHNGIISCEMHEHYKDYK